MQDVTKRAERMTVLVVSPCQPDIRVSVRFVGADINHAQSASIPDRVEAGLFASSCVGDDFFNLEPGESRLEVGEVIREKGRIATGGWAKGGGQNPVSGTCVVEELTSVTVVAVDHATNTGTSILGLDGRVWACPGSLVVASVDDKAGPAVSRRCLSTDDSTRLVIAVAPLLSFLLSRTRTGRWFVAAGFHA
jgi:hypothetical protein